MRKGLNGVVILLALLAHVAIGTHGKAVQWRCAFLRPLGQRLRKQVTPPPYTEQDTKVRTDAAWKEAAESYRGWKSVMDEASSKADTAKAKLIELATHSRESGYGVAVTRYWKTGNVDYKKVVELQGVDLEQYRGKSREEIRVTVAG